MGSAIEKLAFQPPNPAYTISRYGKDIRIRYASAGGGDKEKEENKVSFILLNRTAKSGYTVLFSHGNAEDLGHSMEGFVEMAEKMDVQFCAYDYCGYGLSSQIKPSEKQSYRDIDAVFKYLVEEQKIPKERIILMGRSLGSGPTTDLASRTYGIGGLCLLSPLASASAVATNMVPGGLDIFRNDAKITKVQSCPVHIIHGVEDEVVPFSHGKKLFSLVENMGAVPVSNYWVAGAHHNDIEMVANKAYFKSLKEFVHTVEDYRVNVRPTLPSEAEWLEAKKKSGEGWFSSCSS